jgi:hypothetical protein
MNCWSAFTRLIWLHSTKCCHALWWKWLFSTLHKNWEYISPTYEDGYPYTALKWLISISTSQQLHIICTYSLCLHWKAINKCQGSLRINKVVVTASTIILYAYRFGTYHKTLTHACTLSACARAYTHTHTSPPWMPIMQNKHTQIMHTNTYRRT